MISIKKLYLYVVTLISLILIIIGGVRLIDLGLKSFIFKDADMIYRSPAVQQVEPPEGESKESSEPTQEEWKKYERKQKKSRRQEAAAQSLAFLLVGVPLYLYHWKLIRENKQKS